MLDRRSSKISCLIVMVGLLIATALATMDNIRLPPYTTLALIIMIFSMLWFGITMGMDIQYDKEKPGGK